MNLYLLLPLIACISCCTLSMAIASRGGRHGVGRLAAILPLSAAFWALCEVLWSAGADPSTALFLVRLSSLGWVTIGPLTLHLFLEVTGHPLRRRRAALVALYGTAGALVVLDVATPWVHTDVISTSWGYGYRVGPPFVAEFVFTAATFGLGAFLGIRDFRRSVSRGDRIQAYALLGGMMLPLTIASLSDGLMPILGISIPRLGVTSITLFTGMFTWSFYRYGYSLLIPGSFAPQILETIPDGVALLRLDGRIRSANRGLERLAGAEPGELDGTPIEDLFGESCIDLEIEVDEREQALRSVSGDWVPVSISTSRLDDKRGNPMGLVLLTRDLQEIESLRSRLVVSDRLAAVGQLAAGIAHEINNPIAFVHANLGALSDVLESVENKLPAESAERLRPEFEEGRELVEESLEGVDRVVAIVRDVKGFSRTGGSTPEAVDIEPLLDSVVRMAAPQIPANVRIERRGAPVPNVRGAAHELEQVFLNLLVNACHAIGEGPGVIQFATSCENGWVVVEVQDDGCGIPADAAARVFDPFFTTKPAGEGTGLGLAISYQLVKSHGGELSVESDHGFGTRFRVSLPAAQVRT